MLTLKNLKHIFRAYDIRGDATTELTPQIGHEISFGFGQHLINLGKSTVTLAYDGRLSSPALSQAVIKGLIEAGIHVTDVGCGPTPYLYFCDRHLNSDAAVMITGSHNAGHINGLKIVLDHQPFWGDDITQLYTNILDKQPPKYDIEDDFKAAEKIDLQQVYIDYICADYLKHYQNDRNMKIVWDPGNGASGDIVQRLIKQIPGAHHIINGEIDGNFPNHHPDPTLPENLQQLIAEVINTQSDLGIAFDGDADRIGVVTAQGQILYGEHLLELLTPEILTNHPGATIIADVKTSQHFLTVVEQLGGRPLLWKTGHSAIKAKMIELNAPFAAEMSGHIFFADRYFGYDDGLYTALRVIGMLNMCAINLDDWLDARPKFFSTPELRIHCAAKFEIMKLIQDSLTREDFSFSDIDGIRVTEDAGWWMMRASNTQELIVVRAESTLKKKLIEYIDTIIDLLMPYNVEVTDLSNYSELMHSDNLQ